MVVTCTETETNTAKRPKRPVSEAKRAANRANAKSSTGPRTAAGKAASSLNAVIHGMTSNTIHFLPDEVPEEFYQQVQRWADQLGAVTEPEYILVQRSVYNFWKTRRAGNAGAAAITRTIERATATFERDLDRKAAALIPQLPASPAAVAAQLEQCTPGLAWLIGRSGTLITVLKERGYWDSPQRNEFFYLMGVDPRNLFSQPEVMSMLLDCLAAQRDGAPLTGEEAARLLGDLRPEYMDQAEFAQRLAPHVAKLRRVEHARRFLGHVVGQMHQTRLSAREPVAAYERQQRELVLTELKCDVSHEGSLRERYEATADRQMQAALRSLRSLQADRRKYGEGDLSGLEGEGDGAGASASEAEEEPAEAVVRTEETGSSAGASREEGAGERSEATVTQVSGVKTSCDESSGGLPGTDAVPDGAGLGAGSGGAAAGHPARGFEPLRE